jgi:hypothetical protein
MRTSVISLARDLFSKHENENNKSRGRYITLHSHYRRGAAGSVSHLYLYIIVIAVVVISNDESRSASSWQESHRLLTPLWRKRPLTAWKKTRSSPIINVPAPPAPPAAADTALHESPTLTTSQLQV